MLHIFVEIYVIFFSEFLDEYKIEKNSIYLKYKSFVKLQRSLLSL